MNNNKSKLKDTLNEYTPEIMIGKGFRTEQFTISSTPSLIVRSTKRRIYSILIEDTATIVFIGNVGVSISSGFALPTNTIITIGLTENVQLYAVSSSSTILYLLDMGLR